MQFIRVDNNRTTSVELLSYGAAKQEINTFFRHQDNAAICEEIEQANGKHICQVKDRTHKIIFQLKEE